MDIQNRCRLCLSDKNLIDLFHECVVETDELRRFIYDASGVEILKSDHVTKKVCRRCCTVSLKLHKFRTTAITNDKWLKEQFMQLAGNDNNICMIKEEFIDLDSDLEESDVPSCSVTTQNAVSANMASFTCDLSSSLLFSSTPYRPIVKTATSAPTLRIKTLCRSVPTSNNLQNQTLPINITTNTTTSVNETPTIQSVVSNKTVETSSERILRSSTRNKRPQPSACTSSSCRDTEIPILCPVVQDREVKEKKLPRDAKIPRLEPYSPEEKNKKVTLSKSRPKEKQVARKSTTPRLPSNKTFSNVRKSAVYDDPPELDCMVHSELENEKSKKQEHLNGFIGDVTTITDSLLRQLLKGCKSADKVEKKKKYTKPKVRCKYCYQGFSSKTAMHEHCKIHPKCMYCKNKVKDEQRIIRHLHNCKIFNKKEPKIMLQKVDAVVGMREKYPSAFPVEVKQEIEETEAKIEDFFTSTLVEGTEPLELTNANQKPPKNEPQKKITKKAIVKSKPISRSCCPYCKIHVTQLLRHMLWSHQDEAEVAKLMLLPIGSRERIELYEGLKKKGSLFVKDNPDSTPTKPIKAKKIFLFYPCPLCEGYFSKFVLLEHYKICSKKDEVPGDLLDVSYGLINRFLNEANLIMQERAIPFLKDSFSLNVVKNDRLVLQYGSQLSIKYADASHEDFNEFVVQPLKRLAHFLRQFKIVKPMVPNLGAVFNDDLFPDIIYAIKHLRGKNINDFKIAYDLAIRDCVMIELENSRASNNTELESRLNRYLNMHMLCFNDENSWKKVIGNNSM